VLAFAEDARKSLSRFTEKTWEQPVRIAAIGALSRQSSTDAWQPLLEQFASDTPPIRRAILDGPPIKLRPAPNSSSMPLKPATLNPAKSTSSKSNG